jgi:5-methylcytosine-specific restriction protein A
MTERREFTKAVKLDAWKRAAGQCEKCTAKLFPGNVEYHHDKECTYGGAATIENCVVLCRACHSTITGKRAKDIAKSNRVRNRNIGIKKPRTIRAWRKFDGTPVYASRDRS